MMHVKPARPLAVHLDDLEFRSGIVFPIMFVLLKAILSEGAQAGKAVTIHVEIFNPALGWYERLGFTKIAEHGPYQLMECSPCGNACRLEAGQRVGPPA